MKNILAFAGSNSSQSINKQLAVYAGKSIEEVDLTVLDLNDFELPIYNPDIEKEKGIPEPAQEFLNHILNSDGIILSLAEHNGNYAAVFKNLFDWMSRINGKLWNDIPMLLMSTSPGGRGGASVMEVAKARFPFMGGNIVVEFSLPFFNDNFSEGKIIDSDYKDLLHTKIEDFKTAIFSKQ